MTGEKKRRTRKAKPTRTLEQVALEQFAETGELSGLGVLADWLDESHANMSPLATAIRAVMTHETDPGAVRFFYRNAGDMSGTGGLWQLSNRFMGAVHFAEVEAWYYENAADDDNPREVGQLRVRWERDEDYSPDDYDSPDMPEIGWSCSVQSWDGHGWYTDASLHAVAFGGDGYPDGDPYKRIVEAELLSEVKAAWESFDKK